MLWEKQFVRNFPQLRSTRDRKFWPRIKFIYFFQAKDPKASPSLLKIESQWFTLLSAYNIHILNFIRVSRIVNTYIVCFVHFVCVCAFVFVIFILLCPLLIWNCNQKPGQPSKYDTEIYIMEFHVTEYELRLIIWLQLIFISTLH